MQSWLSRPELVCDTSHELELLLHVFVSQCIAFSVTCKTALRAYTELLKCVFLRLTGTLCNEIGCLVDASNHLILVLQLREF